MLFAGNLMRYTDFSARSFKWFCSGWNGYESVVTNSLTNTAPLMTTIWLLTALIHLNIHIIFCP